MSRLLIILLLVVNALPGGGRAGAEISLCLGAAHPPAEIAEPSCCSACCEEPEPVPVFRLHALDQHQGCCCIDLALPQFDMARWMASGVVSDGHGPDLAPLTPCVEAPTWRSTSARGDFWLHDPGGGGACALMRTVRLQI